MFSKCGPRTSYISMARSLKTQIHSPHLDLSIRISSRVGLFDKILSRLLCKLWEQLDKVTLKVPSNTISLQFHGTKQQPLSKPTNLDYGLPFPLPVYSMQLISSLTSPQRHRLSFIIFTPGPSCLLSPQAGTPSSKFIAGSFFSFRSALILPPRRTRFILPGPLGFSTSILSARASQQLSTSDWVTTDLFGYLFYLSSAWDSSSVTVGMRLLLSAKYPKYLELYISHSKFSVNTDK